MLVDVSVFTLIVGYVHRRLGSAMNTCHYATKWAGQIYVSWNWHGDNYLRNAQNVNGENTNLNQEHCKVHFSCAPVSCLAIPCRLTGAHICLGGHFRVISAHINCDQRRLEG